MSGKNSAMTPLQSRKQLLIAESELNRAQLVGEMESLTAGIRTTTSRAKSFASIASSVALLLAGLTTMQRGKGEEPGSKPSWLKRILKGVGMISTLWLAFRPKGPDQEDKQPDSII